MRCYVTGTWSRSLLLYSVRSPDIAGIWHGGGDGKWQKRWGACRRYSTAALPTAPQKSTAPTQRLLGVDSPPCKKRANARRGNQQGESGAQSHKHTDNALLKGGTRDRPPRARIFSPVVNSSSLPRWRPVSRLKSVRGSPSHLY